MQPQPSAAPHPPRDSRGQQVLSLSLAVSTLDVVLLLVSPRHLGGTAYGWLALALAVLGLGVIALAGSRLGERLGNARPAARALTGVALAIAAGLSAVQLTLARAQLTGGEQGLDTATRLVGRAALVALAPVLAVAVLHLWQEHRSTKGFHPIVRLAAFLSVGAAFVGGGVLAIAPRPAARLLLGEEFAVSARLVRQLCFEAGSLAMLTLAAYWFVLRRTRGTFAVWIVALTVVVLGLLRQQDAGDAAWLVVGTGFVVGAGLLAYTLMRSRGFWRDRGPLPMSPLAATAELDVTFVVPFYNPGSTLRPHLEDMVAVLDGTGCSYEIIPVSDGSTDGSERTLQGLPATVRPIVNDTNHGKGHALHIGLNKGRGRYLGFVDADGDIPAHLLTSFVEIVLGEEPELAIGSKKHPESEVVYPLVRRAYSTGYQLLTRVLFGLSVRDTQTGLKIVRRDVLAAALPRMLEKRFAFDLELLVVARRLGYRDIVELPVVIQERLTSTVSWRSVVQVLQDTLAIAYRLRLVGWYDEDHDARPQVRNGSLERVQAS